MGRKARKQYDPNRKFITKRLLAEYLGLSRNTLTTRLKEYGKEVDFHDSSQVLSFVRWTFGIFYTQDGGDEVDGH